MVESAFSSSAIVRQVGGVSYAGLSPPVASQFLPATGLIDFIYSRALNLSWSDGRWVSASTERLRNDRATTGGLLRFSVATADRGLEAELGLSVGLNEFANGLGRNSVLLGLSRAPCALPTPLDLREKFGSLALDGPVGGNLGPS